MLVREAVYVCECRSVGVPVREACVCACTSSRGYVVVLEVCLCIGTEEYLCVP